MLNDIFFLHFPQRPVSDLRSHECHLLVIKCYCSCLNTREERHEGEKLTGKDLEQNMNMS